jgi:hypothetical protein
MNQNLKMDDALTECGIWFSLSPKHLTELHNIVYKGVRSRPF